MDDTQPGQRSKTKVVIRECVAVIIWIYILLKLTVFEIDIYFLDHFAASLRWILDFKAFVLMVVVAVLWVVLGKSSFPKTILYIAAYPAVLLFWKVPKLVLRRWPIVIISAPCIYRLVTTFRTTFLICATLSALAALLSTDRRMLAAATIVLVIFAVVHLVRSFRKAYGIGPFVRLSALLSRLRASIQKGTGPGGRRGDRGAGPSPRDRHQDAARSGPENQRVHRFGEGV